MTLDFSLGSRHRALDQAGMVDLLIIGGGITGAGVAMDAASRGLKPLLLEKDDFVSGTSSRTTKLIHGGLRYLRHLEFGLVREAARERSRLRRMAPHLIEEISFLVPVARRLQKWVLGAGLTVYDALGGYQAAGHRYLREREAAAELPALEGRVRGAYLFSDGKADDCRLTLHVLKKAVQLGARAAHYAPVREFLMRDGRAIGVRVEDRLRHRTLEIHARHIVAATGVWTDRLLAEPVPRLRPTKGIHLVVPRSKIGNRTAVLIPAPDGRVVFAIPWGDRNLLGTTDTDYSGDLDRPRAEPADIEYLRIRFAEALGVRIESSDILATYAGLRPLAASSAAHPSDATRDFSIARTASGVIVVAGGKLTTFRSMARRIVDLARPDLPGSRTHLLDLFAPRCEGPPELLRAYGDETRVILGKPDQQAIHESSPRRVSEIDYCIESEACVSVSDFLIRRTRAVLFDPERGRRSAEPVARRMAGRFGWGRGQTSRQIEEFERELELYA